MNYSSAGVISILSPWHIVGAQSKLHDLSPGVKNTTPLLLSHCIIYFPCQCSANFSGDK